MSKVEITGMTGKLFRITTFMLFVALTIATVGCEYFPESTFQLASESRLPKWITVPPKLLRSDVSLTMSYYSKPWGTETAFVLKDKNGNTLAKLYGKTRDSEPLRLRNSPARSGGGYPSYELVTVNGVTDIIEHRKMEPKFYVTDDPAVWKELTGIQR